MFKFVIYDTCEAHRSANNIIVDHFSGIFPSELACHCRGNFEVILFSYGINCAMKCINGRPVCTSRSVMKPFFKRSTKKHNIHSESDLVGDICCSHTRYTTSFKLTLNV